LVSARYYLGLYEPNSTYNLYFILIINDTLSHSYFTFSLLARLEKPMALTGKTDALDHL
jgi:hypothetical protein